MENLILVDSSYTSFYRFFATLRWMSMANKEVWAKYKDKPEYNWLKNKIFKEKYTKMYLESIVKLVKKKVYKKSMVIFCLYAKKETLWRHNLTKDYKGNRADLSKKRNFGPTFRYTYNTLIPKLVKDNDHIFSIKEDKVEADDIIAVICKNMEVLKKNYPIYLISGDEDFKQLGRKNLYFINYKSKKLIELSKKEAENNLLLKIISGDSSDNIKCIFPKDKKIINNKKRKEVKESKAKLNKFLDENKEAKKKFKLNKNLIDFEMIPKKYIKNILRKYKNYYKLL